MKRTSARWTWPLIFMLAGGTVGIVLAVELLPEGTLTDLLLAFSTAVFGAAILGLTADWWLKQELARDAFNATFGYLLPEELRGELQWVYSQEMVCSSHYQEVRVEPTDDPNLVVVTSKSERTLRNIKNTPHKFRLPYSIDEWGHAGKPSRILDMGCQARGEVYRDFTVTNLEAHIDGQGDAEVLLDPEESIDVWCVGQETKRRNDDIRDIYLNATHNPRVTVLVPDGFDFSVGFGSPRSAGQRRVGDDTVRMDGTLLPMQAITVRWWPKRDLENPSGA